MDPRTASALTANCGATVSVGCGCTAKVVDNSSGVRRIGQRRVVRVNVMQTRHAAALALVVYLMLLPKGVQYFNVPWSATQRTFDTAQECEKMRGLYRRQHRATQRRGETPKPIERGYYCIAADDPSIKE
jgi:hypothetical protein